MITYVQKASDNISKRKNYCEKRTREYKIVHVRRVPVFVQRACLTRLDRILEALNNNRSTASIGLGGSTSPLPFHQSRFGRTLRRGFRRIMVRTERLRKAIAIGVHHFTALKSGITSMSRSQSFTENFVANLASHHKLSISDYPLT